MKIIMINGSPHKNGNTAVLARAVLAGAEAAGADTEELFLGDYKIEYCLGCIGRSKRLCTSQGFCIINDDAMLLRDKIYASDGIVFACPAYGMQTTARFKNFIFDRIGMFTAYTSKFAGKYLVGVSTCGGIGAKKVARRIARDYAVGFHARAYVSGSVSAYLGYAKMEDQSDILQKAVKLGNKMVQDIISKNTYPFQFLFDRIIMKLMVRRIIVSNIIRNKEGIMKAVYQNLTERNLI